jgi:hypothetical protein
LDEDVKDAWESGKCSYAPTTCAGLLAVLFANMNLLLRETLSS